MKESKNTSSQVVLCIYWQETNIEPWENHKPEMFSLNSLGRPLVWKINVCLTKRYIHPFKHLLEINPVQYHIQTNFGGIELKGII